MPKLTLDLHADISIALRRFAAEDGQSREYAAVAALRDWLIANGYLELEHDLAEDTETIGRA
jgi:hypothetical protein